MKKNWKKAIAAFALFSALTFIGLEVVAKKKKASSVYDDDLSQKNSLEGKRVVFIQDDTQKKNADGLRGHLEAVGATNYDPTSYEKYVKRSLDVLLSFGGLVALSPVMGMIALAIYIEDPGPVLFTQKRVGKNKEYFKLHKFRSMRLDTPHDTPTHQLDNPDKYITKVGKFIRKHSLDELPQIWDIFIGNMSVIGPRPALWNQDFLIAERDKYSANDVKPGLTGWAQINGRDELEIPEKAMLDGEYVKKMSAKFDSQIFLESLHVIGKDESVVEGRTDSTKKIGSRNYLSGKSDRELKGVIGFQKAVKPDHDKEIKVLITGKGSYIGESLISYAKKNYPNIHIDSVDLINPDWEKVDFSGYDVVYHVAGLAHADIGSVDEETKEKYYSINTDLAIKVAEKARREGAKEFIFMSSMIVYGDSAPCGQEKMIDQATVPSPANFYGDSKLQADVAVRDLATESFKVIVLRPPMIYGKESKGNFPTLEKISKAVSLFPNINNQRSMLYIGNFCEFLCQIMSVTDFEEKAVVLIPQNAEWTKTSNMVKKIAELNGKEIKLVKGPLNFAVSMAQKVPGKIGGLVNKAFGNYCYSYSITQYEGLDYQIYSLEDSLKICESDQTDPEDGSNSNRQFDEEETSKEQGKQNPKAMVLASVASMIDQFNMDNINLLLQLGFDVDVVCNCKVGSTISDERIQSMISRLENMGVRVFDAPIPRKITDVKGMTEAFNQVKKLCNQNHYSILHCHSPIGSVIARMAVAQSRKEFNTRVIYTAHGFHFYQGAPVKNWLLYYPIEKLCSYETDVLITINKEDYNFAKENMSAKKVIYIPGVGIDTKKYFSEDFDRNSKRKSLGLNDGDLMVLSVGELNDNKNHETIIRAISQLNDSRIHYFIAGKGNKKEYLQRLGDELGVNLHLLGYRTDINELLNSADIFALPSFREGLSVALMEAMAAGLPCLVSKIRGNVDLIDNGFGGFLCNPDAVDQFKEKIRILCSDPILRNEMSKRNESEIKKYDRERVLSIMENIYSER